MSRSFLSIAALSVFLAACAAQAQTKTMQTSMGPVLTDSRGMTLYTFDKDEPGKSNCYAQCAVNWPPIVSEQASGEYSVVQRTDGAKQLAYKGKPLYLWVKDTKPGEMTGEGVNNVWHVAKP